MRPEQIAAVLLIVGFFVSLASWLWVVWPESDPLRDEDRRR